MAYAAISALADNDAMCHAGIIHGADGVSARYQGLTLTSHFQPVFSLSHGRAIGHEGLLRACDDERNPVSPGRVIASATRYEDLHHIDQLCRYLHANNHSAHDTQDGWLFLSIEPEVSGRGPKNDDLGNFLPELCEHPNIDSRRIVIEVVEQVASESSGFARTVEYLRDLGCMIALGDFGAGHPSFDRIGSLQPEIVKLGRSFAIKSVEDPSTRRLLPQIVSLIHEAGSLVLLEGVETEAQALLALDADIDFVQGFYFAMPEATPIDTRTMNPLLNALWEEFNATRGAGNARARELIEPYLNAIGGCALLLEDGTSLDDACCEFLQMERADSCFLLDGQGRQMGNNARPRHSLTPADTPYRALAANRSAHWSRRPYFRHAVERPGKIHVTRPYLSISTGLLCVTVSIAFRNWNDELQVLCGDVHWPQVV